MSAKSETFSWDGRGFRLASASPRRQALLAQVGLHPEVMPVAVDETPHPGEGAEACVLRLALAKARAGLAAGGDCGLCLGADTVVALEGHILGKPRDAEEARAMLARLSGREHTVWTGIALCRRDGAEAARAVATRVRVKPLLPAEIAAYVATGEPLDKAGAYALQGRGAFMVQEIAGSCSGVVGLPLAETLELLLALHEE